MARSSSAFPMQRAPRLRTGITDPVALVISRSEVEQGDIAPVLARLRAFMTDRHEAWRYKGQVTLVVSGYEDDPRSLVDVPAVRDMLRRLEAAWDEWGYFLNQVDDSIKLLLACAAGASFPGDGRVQASGLRLQALMHRGLRGVDAVFRRFGFPDDERDITGAGLAEVFDQLQPD